MQASILGSELTSIGIGGPVQWLAKPKTADELAEALETDLPLHFLGGGSNLILADEGLEGLLIQPMLHEIELLDEEPDLSRLRQAAGYYTPEKREGMLVLPKALEVQGKPCLVRMGAGVPWGQAVSWSLRQNLAGLQWYARIPCRIGGAVYNNIHGEKHLLSEVIYRVESLDRQGIAHIRYPEELDFGYDQSWFHTSDELITSVTFCLQAVTDLEAAALLTQYQEWTIQKTKVQPSGKNCGSVFRNLPPEVALAGQQAAAWYIDQCGLRGYEQGTLQVYPGHANFIVNRGGGTQADFITLVELIRERVNQRFGMWLNPEVECWDQQGQTRKWLS